MWSASQLLFLWQTGSRYPILEVCEFQFWQCRDCSCHVFTNFGRFKVEFDRPEFDRTHHCLLILCFQDDNTVIAVVQEIGTVHTYFSMVLVCWKLQKTFPWIQTSSHQQLKFHHREFVDWHCRLMTFFIKLCDIQSLVTCLCRRVWSACQWTTCPLFWLCIHYSQQFAQRCFPMHSLHMNTHSCISCCTCGSVYCLHK